MEFWVICFTCIDSAWGTTKIIVGDGNSILGKDATFNNMFRNVTPYDENDRCMFLRNVRPYQENDRSMFLRNSSDFILNRRPKYNESVEIIDAIKNE